MKVFSFWKTPKNGNVPPYVLMGLASMKMTFGDDFLLLTERNLHKHVDVKLNRDIEFSHTSQHLTPEVMKIVAFSDYVRMLYVHQNGGLWLDADSIAWRNFKDEIVKMTEGGKLAWHSEQLFAAQPGNQLLGRGIANIESSPKIVWGNPGDIKGIVENNRENVNFVNYLELVDPGIKPAYNCNNFQVILDEKLSVSDFVKNEKLGLIKMYNSNFIKFDISKQSLDLFFESETLLTKLFLSIEGDEKVWKDCINEILEQI